MAQNIWRKDQFLIKIICHFEGTVLNNHQSDFKYKES